MRVLFRRLLSTRPRRSALYLPGANLRAVEKARTLPADVLLMDCEDAVAPDRKELARSQIAAALSSSESYGHRELVVRINALASPWGEADVATIAPLERCDAILLPKAESVESVQRLAELMEAARRAPPRWRTRTRSSQPLVRRRAAAPRSSCSRAASWRSCTFARRSGLWRWTRRSRRMAAE